MSTETRQRLTVAIAAMGGQGGGVLADWIVAVAESAGYHVQATSVPGVAQRTGATIYYIEIHPRDETAGEPVLALMPVPGDVDVVIAAELVEAGRAVQRGIVTKDRTTLIASTHRHYAYAEKSAMGDGRIVADTIETELAGTARRLVCFDMQALAEAHHTVISATLFGALAGAAVLPFERARFEDAIRRSGKALDNNLAAFDAAFARAAGAVAEKDAATPAAAARPSPGQEVQTLLQIIAQDFPAPAHEIIHEGVRRVLDYQDPAYARQYLDDLKRIKAIDDSVAGGDARLTTTTARHLALWMSFEDTIRVAELKTRGERFERCRHEVLAVDKEIVQLTEFMHPRIEEVADSLPAPIGRWLIETKWANRWLDRLFLRERKIRTTTVCGFLLLYAVSGLKRFRRSTYRYAIERNRIDQWLERIERLARDDYDLAVEVALCQNLIKGYGDTHARGVRSYTAIMRELDAQPATIGAARIRELREAALADEEGATLQTALRQIA